MDIYVNSGWHFNTSETTQIISGNKTHVKQPVCNIKSTNVSCDDIVKLLWGGGGYGI